MEASADASLSIGFARITPAIYDFDSETFSGAVYGPDGGLVHQSLRPDATWRFAEKGAIGQNPEPIGRGVYIGRFFRHFGHFLTETLPGFGADREADRLVIAHPWPAQLDHRAFAVPYIGFCLAALRVDVGRIVFATRDLLVRDLVVAPQNSAVAGRLSRAAVPVYRRIRDCALAGSAAATPKRIYFSRRRFLGAARRRLGLDRSIVNEDATEELFRKRRFAIVYPETLPFAEQIRIAARADIVAGVDGSALHLCGFMEPGGRCVVVDSRRRAPAISAINDMAGISTHWIEGVCTTRPIAGGDEVTIDAVLLDRRLAEFVDA